MNRFPAAIIPVLTFAALLVGCGKEKSTKDQPPDLDFTTPVYSILPDTAPLRDQLDEAAASIERELLEEQEKFLLKRKEEIQSYYTTPNGSLLVPESSIAKMLALMETPTTTRLKIRCLNFQLLVAAGAGGTREAPITTAVRMMGDQVRAHAEYSGSIGSNTLKTQTEFIYTPEGSTGTQGSRRVQRTIVYEKEPSGTWRRVRIDEAVPTIPASPNQSLPRPPR